MLKYFKITVYLLQQEMYPMFFGRIRFKIFLHSTHFGKRMVYLSHTLYCVYKTFAGAKRTASTTAMEVLL